ncbi:AAA family ATPase [bacterium]|nr:AAA family ATPase [bacterium]NIN92619.1 AAA family ATPase [bacterium]NIO18644.1 AAA family ATPase [bacterium]NIO73666.1 AAA family ATPase [bacterium]
MAFTIAVAGKGGSGKTTLATLTILHLIRQNKGPVLAVDADPNSNLNVGLGMEFEQTIADLREEVLTKEIPSGMSKTDFFDYRLHQCLVEGDKVDLLVMGRPEGPGCYCAVNNLLRQYLSRISKQYKYVVMDNEAGMEHLSRRTTDGVDVLLITSDPTLVSIRSAARIQEIALQIKLRIKEIHLVINRISESKDISSLISGSILDRLSLLENIPEDPLVLEASEKEKDLLSLPEESPSFQAVGRLMRRLKL